MPQWLIILGVFILGLLSGVFIPYVYQVMDLKMTRLSNNLSLESTQIQQQINQLSGSETPELMPAIGFQIPQDYYEEEYEEENKI